jgi:3-deoxy-D-manno-octulosonic acid kinase
MLDTPFGKAVLRVCLRGGWAAHLSRDQYVFTGYYRSRPVVEVNLLARLRSLNLPVPQPLAGLCRRNGLTYSGALLTRRIEPATTLADALGAGHQGEIAWVEVGRCVRSFHDAGVVHPDLNARNIVLGADLGAVGDIYLVDFDRAFVRAGAVRSFSANLARLQRSLRKFWPEIKEKELSAYWQEFKAG